jgi:hypothetical protein
MVFVLWRIVKKIRKNNLKFMYIFIFLLILSYSYLLYNLYYLYKYEKQLTLYNKNLQEVLPHSPQKHNVITKFTNKKYVDDNGYFAGGNTGVNVATADSIVCSICKNKKK